MASKADPPLRRRGLPGTSVGTAGRKRRIVYLPLDERPCNLLFPQLQLPRSSRAEIIAPPRSLLGYKKTPADRKALLKWLESELARGDYAVLSVEMLLYGGLLASRVHTESEATILDRVHDFSALLCRTERRRGAAGPMDLSLFGLIMRTPSYSSDEEEPDYYREYGRSIFHRGYLEHKAEHEPLAGSEQALLAEARCIPDSILEDYDARRRANLAALKALAELLVEQRVTRLVLPEDDTATYGYGPREKASLLAHLQRLGVLDRVLSYPGADEVGMTLTARAALDGAAPLKVFVAYSHEGAEAVVPKYESQPLGKSVVAHIRAAGGEVCENPEEAELVLGVPAVPGCEAEAWAQDVESLLLGSDDGQRREQYYAFAERLKSMAEGPRTTGIALADCAYSNGADRRFVESVQEAGLWPYVFSFAAWNTAGNTLGTAVSRGCLEARFPEASTRSVNLVYRLLDDWAYQAYARARARNETEETANVPSPASLTGGQAGPESRRRVEPGEWAERGVPDSVAGRVERDMRELWHAVVGVNADGCRRVANDRAGSSEGSPTFQLPADPGIRRVRFPWNRLFEIEIDLER
ncbi:MAG: DUF4127 family protein [bacterium]